MTFVYFPLATWSGARAGCSTGRSAGPFPVLDFAGGTVVHISSGVSALVCALVLGKRLGYPREPMPPHNVVLSLIGTGLLWVGWFGFNAGSAVNAGKLATSAFAATHFSAAAAALSWAVVRVVAKGQAQRAGRRLRHGRRAGHHHPRLGLRLRSRRRCSSAWRRASPATLPSRGSRRGFGYDDSLDVFGVHGVGSTVGMLMLGFLASADVNTAIATTFKTGGHAVSLAGGGAQFLNQLKGVLFTLMLSGGVSFILLKLVNALIGLRVDREEESLGLDLSQHGESAYND